MKHHIVATAILPALLFAACTPAAPGTGDADSSATMESGSTGSAPNDDMMNGSAGMMNGDGTMMDREGTMPENGMMNGSAGMMNGDAGAMMEKKAATQYLPYTDGVIGNGQTSVLFFHAGWCPYCQTKDRSLTEWYTSGTLAVSTYKVDFDSEEELKTRYGVVLQDTFVLIDGEGNSIRALSGFPSESDVLSMLQEGA